MQNPNFSGYFSNSDAKVEVTVSIFQFEENGITILYSPALDLSGYCQSLEEAKKSFETTIGEFFNYTIHKKTLAKELRRLGWSVKAKARKLKTPGLTDLIKKHDYLVEILNEKQFTKFDHKVSVPC
jgi:hypothetical protein